MKNDWLQARAAYHEICKKSRENEYGLCVKELEKFGMKPRDVSVFLEYISANSIDEEGNSRFSWLLFDKDGNDVDWEQGISIKSSYSIYIYDNTRFFTSRINAEDMNTLNLSMNLEIDELQELWNRVLGKDVYLGNFVDKSKKKQKMEARKNTVEKWRVAILEGKKQYWIILVRPKKERGK